MARPATIVTPEDPRLAGTAGEDIAGADQIPRLLRATPDERLDGLVAAVQFIQEARLSLKKATAAQ